MAATTPIQTNQPNAPFSTKPAAERGQVAVSRNGLKHGLLSQLKVLPGLERQEAWDAHYNQTLQDTAPVGHMETLLAERVALLLWRLGRVARYERECAAAALEHVDERLSRSRSGYWDAEDVSPIAEGEGRVLADRQMLGLIDRLTDTSDTNPIEPEPAARLLDELAETLDVDIYGEKADIELPDYPDGADPAEVDWDGEYLRQCLGAVAGHAEVGLAEALASMAHAYRQRLSAAQHQYEQLCRQRDQYRRLRIVPDEDQVAKITRYEAHLERCLWRTMHELQRLQAARVNQSVPAPIAVDVTMTANDEAA